MFTLTRKTDYALVAMTAIARAGEQSCSARELAEQHALPLPALRNILKQLAQQALITASRGPQGGYRLARRAEHIAVADLIEAMEGPMKLALCCRADDDPDRCKCELEGNCLIQEPVKQVNRLVRGVLGRVTLAQLAEGRVPQSLHELAEHTPLSELFPPDCTCHLRGVTCDHSHERMRVPADD